ncbi:monomethylamine:corrinoid methyltransferase [Candidatus Bipolaricaulota bacterium]|nr:monomethylamine:corrinoid methyltransferase [Candidatus Bipolaricaulota bacterium]
MLDPREIYQRASKGSTVDEDEFDLHHLYSVVSELVNDYGIKYDPDNPVPANEKLADKVFAASIDFLDQVGIYCRDTNRVIEFSRREIKEAARNMPSRCLFGKGKERQAFTGRSPDSKKEPWYHVGLGSVVSSEEVASELVKGFARIGRADSVAIPALPSRSGVPTEIYDAIRTVELGKTALREAGRPELPIINLLSTAGTALATIAASNPNFGIRSSDGWLVGMLAEMKLEFGALNRVIYLQNRGGNIGAESGPLVGGYGGGAEGTAILNTAYVIAGRLLFQSSWHLTFPLHIKYSCSSTRDVIWTTAVSAQAISRNLDLPTIFLAYQAAGPFTKMYFYETAAYITAAITSGVSAQAPLPAKATSVDYITPKEMQFSVEAAHAATKLSRSEANELVKQLLDRYEDKLDDPPPGKKYQECYDMKTGKVEKEYQEFYDRMKEEISAIGLEFSE